MARRPQVELTISQSVSSGGVELRIRPCYAPLAPEADDDARAKKVWGRLDELLQSYRLSNFGMVIAKKWLRRIADPSLPQFDRLRPWLLNLINGRLRARPESPWQAGCPEILPKLRAQPVWDASELPWLRAFEEHACDIREELLALRTQRGFQPLRVPAWASRNAVDSTDGHGQLSHDAGDWNVFYLSLHEVCAGPCCCALSRGMFGLALSPH